MFRNRRLRHINGMGLEWPARRQTEKKRQTKTEGGCGYDGIPARILGNLDRCSES